MAHGCIYCTEDMRCTKDGDEVIEYCVEGPCSERKMTNGDRIRAMTDEELADFMNDAEYGFLDRPGMCSVCDRHRLHTCRECWLDWLKQEVDDGD